jgi:urate oxidase
MPLIHHTYGKARVRVMRVHRDDEYNEVRELSVQAMLEGGFGESFTAGDNRAVIATDTIKNIAYVVARENMTASAEAYGQALAARLLDRYPQVSEARVSLHGTRWTRAVVDGRPHPHSFVLDANGRPTAMVVAPQGAAAAVTSGIAGYTFMKSTASGWAGYVMDEYTTLPETTDRIAATAMDARWTWLREPAGYDAANARVLAAMLEVFAATYSKGVQDSLYRMGEAALTAVPELATVHMACPNKHYLPVRLEPFGLASDNMVFAATDEPHGQIECTVGR